MTILSYSLLPAHSGTVMKRGSWILQTHIYYSLLFAFDYENHRWVSTCLYKRGNKFTHVAYLGHQVHQSSANNLREHVSWIFSKYGTKHKHRQCYKVPTDSMCKLTASSFCTLYILHYKINIHKKGIILRNSSL